MADFNQPTNTSSYSGIWATVRSLIASCIKLDPSSDSNIPTGAFRNNATSGGKFQTWNGASWADYSVHFGNAVGIGTTSPATNQKLDVRGRVVCGSGSADAEMSWRDTGSTTIRWSLSTRTDVGGSNSDLKLLRYNSGGTYQGLAMQISEAGNVFFATAAGDLTASAANCFIQSSDGRIMRSTSSGRYKTNIEDVLPSFYKKALLLRARWFRSKNAADRPDWSHYGLIAEEVAEVEPRLVHWDYTPESYEEVTVEADVQVGVGEDGQPLVEKRSFKERRLRPEEERELRPDGVQYERLAVLLLPLVREHEQEIAALKARNEALEARLAALEAKLTA